MQIWLKFTLLGTATLSVIIDIALFFSGRKEEFGKTGVNTFLFEDLFFIGARVMRIFHRGTNGKRVRKLEEIYDGALAGQIARNASFAPYTYFCVFAPIVLMVFAVSESKAATAALCVFVAFLMSYFDIWLNGAIKKRHGIILCEFATVLSKMSLLVNAGITAADAFARVADSGEGVLYVEMQRAVADIKNGKSTDEAFDEFCFRCGCKEVRKFVSLYKQNLIKGGPEFPFLLQDMASAAWDERKARARLLGAAAEQKLLIPIMLMFIGVLIMVIVPAFNNLL